MEDRKNVILGAGLAGLSTAYHLDESYVIYEKLERGGGVCRSVRKDGFAFDHGPHILYPSTEYARDLIKGLLGDNLRIEARKAGIFHLKYDRYTNFPFQAHLYGLPEKVVFGCLRDLYHELHRAKYDEQPKNYLEWMVRRFGQGIVDNLMLPYARKIWTVEPTEMNYAWISERVPEPDFEVILEGALMESSQKVGANKAFWYPIVGGIECLPEALIEKVGNIHLNMEVVRIDPLRREVEFANGDIITYDRLVSTLPLPEVIAMLPDVPDDVKTAAQSLQYNSIICCNLGVNREKISDAHWLYFYEDEFVFHRISFPMNLSPKAVPEGKSAVSCEIAYSRFRGIERSTIVERTIDGLQKAHILREDDEIVLENVIEVPCAYIIYDLNHRKNVDMIRSYLFDHGIYPCGRFGEWEYFNMDHSIMSGKRMAEKLNEMP